MKTKTYRRVVSVILVFAIIISFGVVKTSLISKAASVLSVSKKSVTVKPKKKKTVTFVTSKRLGMTATVVSGSDKIGFKWGKWKYKKKKYRVTMTIKGKQSGNAKIKVTNTYNKQKIYIKVKVSGREFIKLPSIGDNIPGTKLYISSIRYTLLTDDTVYVSGAYHNMGWSPDGAFLQIKSYYYALYDEKGKACIVGSGAYSVNQTEGTIFIELSPINMKKRYKFKFISEREYDKLKPSDSD